MAPGEDNAGRASGVRYYRSDLRPLPVIFVQRAWSWSSFSAGGVMLEYCPGPIPADRMPGLEEIDQAEADRWLDAELLQVTDSEGEVTVEERQRSTIPAEPILFEPVRWRQWVFGPPAFFVFVYIVLAAVMIVRSQSHPGAPLAGELAGGFGLLLVVLFAVTFSMFKGRLSTYAVTLTETSITTQTGFWRSRASGLLLMELDTVSSARRGLIGRLFGWQRLYTKQGDSILLLRRYFDPAVVRDLFDRLKIQV